MSFVVSSHPLIVDDRNNFSLLSSLQNQGLLAKMSDLERMVAAERAKYKAMQEKYSHDTKHWAELKQMLLSEEHELIDRSVSFGYVRLHIERQSIRVYEGYI